MILRQTQPDTISAPSYDYKSKKEADLVEISQVIGRFDGSGDACEYCGCEIGRFDSHLVMQTTGSPLSDEKTTL